MTSVSISPPTRQRPGSSLIVAALGVAVVCGFGLAGCAADDGGDAPAGTVDSVAQWKADGEKILANVPCGTNPMTCKGAKLPTVALTDFNPTSATFEKTQSIGELSDKPKVVALLAAW